MDEHCRITVVGERRQVDVAVPADAPVASYIDVLARMCDQDQADVMPPAWSLATATAPPFAPEWSLAELGIVDGQILYLRDVIAEEFVEPVVHDVGERVTEVADSALDRRWDAAARTVGVMVLGLGWLVGTLLVLAARHQVGAPVLTAAAAAAGLVLPAPAWMAAERGWPVPAGLRAALALCAVPVLGLAGWLSAGLHAADSAHGPGAPMTTAGFAAFALLCGGLVGAFLAYVAAPGVTTCAVLVALAVAAAVSGALALARPDVTGAAAVVAVVAFGLLTVVPATVSRIVGSVYRRPGSPAPVQDDVVAAAVRAATTLLVLWSGGLAAVLGTALVVLADARSWYAGVLAGCLGTALLLRAGVARLAAEVAPVGLAGVAGLFTLLLVGAEHAGWPRYAGPGYAGLVAVVLLGYGFRRLMRRPELQQPDLRRPGWLTGLSSVLGGVGVALALGECGLFSQLVEFGQRI